MTESSRRTELNDESDGDNERGQLRLEGHADKFGDGLQCQWQFSSQASTGDRNALTLSVLVHPVFDLLKP